MRIFRRSTSTLPAIISSRRRFKGTNSGPNNDFSNPKWDLQIKADTSSDSYYKSPFKFGIGGVPLGNEFSVATDEDANAILEAAWSAGVRYYDVAPWYGLGLAERRFGYFLHNKNRSDYVLSSKVGKLLKASKTAPNRDLFPFSPSPNDVVFDYTGSGIRRSIEDSLQRLGIDSLDIAFVHDLSPDNKLLPTSWEEQFKIATTGAFAELTRMRKEGIIKGWGLGLISRNRFCDFSRWLLRMYAFWPRSIR